MTENAPKVVETQADTQEAQDAEVESAVAAQIALVGPILKEFMRHATEGTDYWLRKSSLRILANWIMSLQDSATLMQQQLEAAQQVLGAQEKELEELRPVKNKIWTPFS